MILIPVKDLGGAKQRLASVLTQEQRTLLAQAMLQDVLAAVHGLPARPAVALVTGYPPAAALARKYGFEVIEDGENAGESQAIAMATRVALSRGATETLVIPADMPLMRTEELQAIYAAAPSRGVVLVPSADLRGSNAILRRPGDLIALRFGNDSFVPHRESVRASGEALVVLELPGIGLDVDTPADLANLMALPHTSGAQKLLAQWTAEDVQAAGVRRAEGPGR